MGFIQVFFRFALAAVIAYLLSALAMTYFTIAEYRATGLAITIGQMVETYWLNVKGLGIPAPGAPLPFAAIQSVALAIAFLVAAGVKRMITALAPTAFPVAGLVALPLLVVLIETVMIGDGVGVFFGARGPLGLALQGLAGLCSGIVFAALGRRD